jgi:hypothetical protein
LDSDARLRVMLRAEFLLGFLKGLRKDGMEDLRRGAGTAKGGDMVVEDSVDGRDSIRGEGGRSFEGGGIFERERQQMESLLATDDQT